MKRSAWIALIFIWLAFAGSAIVSRSTFDRLPHLEDEFAYLYQARVFAHGDVYAPVYKPVRAYWQPFLVNLNDHRVGKYTPGWPLVLAIGVLFEQPWIITAWLAMLTVAVVYRLGRDVFNPETGAVAALLTAASPGALLLSGTLMGHTAALFFVTLFFWAMWRLENGKHPLTWAVTAGVSLGMVVITRPLSAVGIVAPFVVYSVGRVLWDALKHSPERGWLTLKPLMVLGVLVVAISMLWPAFNWTVAAKTDESFPAFLVRFLKNEPDTNLYWYIWKYDRIGFGEGHGRVEGGHTVELGWKHAKQDLSCAAHDLFGWAEPAPDKVNLDTNQCAETGHGYSWLLLPLGLLMGMPRKWTWLFAAVPVTLVAAYLAYWIGGRLYTARYYSEALTAVTLVSAYGVTALAALIAQGYKRVGGPSPSGFTPGWLLYAALAGVMAYAVAIYTPARLKPLDGYGRINQEQIDDFNALREQPDKPALLLVWGEHHWRDVGAFMAVTDPFLGNDIVLARDPDAAYLDQILSRWPDREHIFLINGEFTHSPPEQDDGGD
ncbi:MAG TPA: glycosyltransferase family 39 protein [Aggregatilinea sp.]|uniref:ArnT family glycosyltransferase n=1 Tax=Aggregatilinea sp. TaxID=2806333 RepID=UPI002CACF187|nr:glycosyltransferase family 39 protein [Aggregatilinea sp.]HML22907.1 glycosyltransferase family 39 protein [Aggregatilinea sp.]